MCLINQQFKNKQNNAHIKDSKCVSLYFAAEQLNILVNISLLGSSARCSIQRCFEALLCDDLEQKSL